MLTAISSIKFATNRTPGFPHFLHSRFPGGLRSVVAVKRCWHRSTSGCEGPQTSRSPSISVAAAGCHRLPIPCRVTLCRSRETVLPSSLRRGVRVQRKVRRLKSAAHKSTNEATISAQITPQADGRVCMIVPKSATPIVPPT